MEIDHEKYECFKKTITAMNIDLEGLYLYHNNDLYYDTFILIMFEKTLNNNTPFSFPFSKCIDMISLALMAYTVLGVEKKHVFCV